MVLCSAEKCLPCSCSSARRSGRPSQSAAPHKPPRILCSPLLVSSPGAQTAAAPSQGSPKGEGWAALTPAVPAGPGEEESTHRSHTTASVYSLLVGPRSHMESFNSRASSPFSLEEADSVCEGARFWLDCQQLTFGSESLMRAVNIASWRGGKKSCKIGAVQCSFSSSSQPGDTHGLMLTTTCCLLH